MGMLPRHAIAKAKARRSGHAAKGYGMFAAKAKACVLPRPWQPHGHAAKANACGSQGKGMTPKARCQGRGSLMGTSQWARCHGQGL